MTSANRCPKHGPASLHVCGTFKSDGEAIGISWDKTIASGCEVLQCCETRRMEDVFVRGQTRVIRESAGRDGTGQADENADSTGTQDTMAGARHEAALQGMKSRVRHITMSTVLRSVHTPQQSQLHTMGTRYERVLAVARNPPNERRASMQWSGDANTIEMEVHRWTP